MINNFQGSISNRQFNSKKFQTKNNMQGSIRNMQLKSQNKIKQ